MKNTIKLPVLKFGRALGPLKVLLIISYIYDKKVFILVYLEMINI